MSQRGEVVHSKVGKFKPRTVLDRPEPWLSPAVINEFKPLSGINSIKAGFFHSFRCDRKDDSCSTLPSQTRYRLLLPVSPSSRHVF